MILRASILWEKKCYRVLMIELFAEKTPNKTMLITLAEFVTPEYLNRGSSSSVAWIPAKSIQE
jgi:hypothetical protein